MPVFAVIKFGPYFSPHNQPAGPNVKNRGILDKVYRLSACNIFYHNNRRNSAIPAFITATLETLKCVIMSSRLKAQGSNTIVLVVEEIIFSEDASATECGFVAI